MVFKNEKIRVCYREFFWIVCINFRFQPNSESRNENVLIIGQNTSHSEDKEPNDDWKTKQRAVL